MNKAKNAYYGHRCAARRRNIPFQLTFDEWYNWWLSQGVDKSLKQPPKSANTLCMCRIGDIGPYSLSNIYCDSLSNNALSAWTNGKCSIFNNQQRQLGRANAAIINSKPVSTPYGIFPSRSLAIKHYNTTVGIFKMWMRTKSDEFYYL